MALKKLGFITVVLGLVAAIAALVGGGVLLSAHGTVTVQEDYHRRVTKDMGHNVLIINSEQNAGELRTLGYPNTYLDYEDVWKLAHADIETLNHLLPVLQERITWVEQDFEIMLSGIRGQVPVFSKPEFLTEDDTYRSPLVERVPDGKADLGYAVAKRLELRPGDQIEIKGQEFTVNRVYPERGTTEDIMVWIPLEKAQMILGRAGKINGIFALECVCDPDKLGMVSEEVLSVLPHVQVFEFTSRVRATAEVRQKMEETRREEMEPVISQHEALREGVGRFALVIILLFAAGAGVLIFVLILNGMRAEKTKEEVGMKQLPKGLFLGSVAIGFGIANVLLALGTIQVQTGDPGAGAVLVVLSWLPMLFGAIVMAVLWYRMWAAIQDGNARTTPGKAVGYFFIPFFNIYWAFQAIWGYAKDFNKYIQRHDVKTQQLPESLFLTFTILCFTGWIPTLGLLLIIFNYFIGLVMVYKICDGVNAIVSSSSAE